MYRFRRHTIITIICAMLCVSVGCAPKVPGSIISIAHGTLLELNIIDENDMDKGEFITNLEVLEVILSIAQGNDYASYNSFLLSEWYQVDSTDVFQPLDYLSEEHKLLILGSLMASIVTLDDISTIQMDDNATYLEAITYTIRLIGDTYGCTDSPAELRYQDIADIYKTAFEKGVIGDENPGNASSPIPRVAFYEIIYNAITNEQSVGGYVTVTIRYIDVLRERAEATPEDKKEILTTITEIPVDYTISDDLIISWTLPPEYEFLFSDGFSLEYKPIAWDGIHDIGYSVSSTSMYYAGGLDEDTIIGILAEIYPEKPRFLRCIFYRYNDDYTEKEEWYCDIDISNIDYIIEGDEVTPGTYTHFHGQWVPKTITLSDGKSFKANTWYLLNSYEHRYRNPEYNGIRHALLSLDTETDMIINENGGHFINGSSVNLDEIRLQEINISKTEDGGFVIAVTPESSVAFTIVEAPKED